MAKDKRVKVVRDRRHKVCGNPDCIVHRNHRRFEPEDIYCTVCQQKLVYACARCGKIIDSKGIDDIFCDECKEIRAERQAKRKARLDKAQKHAGTAVEVAAVVAGPALGPIGKVAPGAAKVISKAAPAAAVAAGVAKAIKKKK